MSMDMNILFRCLVRINMVRVNGFGVLSLKSVVLTIDSGAHQILWARKDVNRAIADLRGMLNFQLHDGRIPEMINWHAEKQGFVSHFLTRIQYSHTTYNDLTQMPVLPYRFSASGHVTLIVV